jgi:hypothetical protein
MQNRNGTACTARAKLRHRGKPICGLHARVIEAEALRAAERAALAKGGA